MKPYIVLTAVGADRPGLVDELSRFLAERNINIDASRRAVLGGAFAIILMASGEQARPEILAPQIPALAKATGLRITMVETTAPSERPRTPSLPLRLTATCLDHPGIVHEITRLLHERGVNVESLETKVMPAPICGTPLFMMRGIVSVPPGEKISALRTMLTELGDRLDIDIELTAIETGLYGE